MKKYHLQRIDIRSVARMYMIIGLALGLIFGIMVMILWSTYEPVHFGTTLLTSFIAICLFAGIGACIMAFFAMLYNLVASKVGGVQIYISEENSLSPSPGNKDDQILT